MFDSGFGGLTVARALIDLLPAEDLVYIGDTGRYPYGPKRPEDVRRFARELAWSLVKDHDVKAIVVACNTAAAAGRQVALSCAACPGFVEFGERGVTAGDEVTVLAERLLAPVRAAGAAPAPRAGGGRRRRSRRPS